MKYLLLFVLVLSVSISFAQPINTKIISIDESSAIFEFELTQSYEFAGVCWNTTGTPTINDFKQEVANPGIGTIQVTATGLSSSTIYYFRTYGRQTGTLGDYSARQYTITKAIWLGNTDSWSTSTNWEDGRDPGASRIVIIPDVTTDPVVSSNASATQILILDGGNLTINDGVTLTVSGDVTVEGGSGSSGIVCEGTGSLSVSGSSNYERYIPADGWHLLSSPNSNSSLTQLSGLYVNSWNEPTADWSYLNSNSSLEIMKGYSVRYGSAAKTVTFTGNFNNGSKSITVTNADIINDTYGWNLVGNPYPSPIDWDASSGWSRVSVNSTVYVYDVSLGGYTQFNWRTQTGPFWIPPAQGFYIFAKTSSSSFGMDNDVRGIASTSYYKKEVEFPFINLKVANQVKADITNIIFHPEATGNFEDYDGLKLFGYAEDLPQVYTFSDDDKLLSINTINSSLIENINESVQLNLGYTSQIETSLSISIKELEGFEDNISVLLYDNVLNEMFDITSNTYEFFTEIGEFNDRFDLYISKSPNNLSETTVNSVNCYVHNNTLVVNTKEPLNNGKILIYDVLGRPIINKSLTTKTRHIFSIPEKTNIFVVNIVQDETFLYRKTLVK